MNLGRWEEGLQALNKVTELKPRGYEAWERKGEFLTLMSRTNESLEAFDRALELIPENDTKERSLVWMAKAQALSYVDRKEETLAALDKVTELNPKYAVAWSTKGYVLGELDRDNESLAAFEEAVKIDPSDSKTWMQKGSQLAYLKRYNESLPDLDMALELIPEAKAKDRATVWLLKGTALNKTGREAEARAAFQSSVNESDRALSSDGNDTSVLEMKGRALLKLLRYDDAIKAFDKAIQASTPGSFRATTAWIGKGDALRALGRNEEALKAYNQAIDLGPIYSDAWAGRGEAQKSMGLVVEASSSFYVARKLGYVEE
jgi:tetratricopeptide (TPR) repeat protein